MPANPSGADRPDPDKFETIAYRWYMQGDPVRALRFAYQGAQQSPGDVRFPLLLALIYDTGLDRPDLALPEYRRALSLQPWMGLPNTIARRMQYLNRQAVLRRVDRSFTQDAILPLPAGRVAVFPLLPSGPRAPDADLTTGLTALLVHAACMATDTPSTDPLDLLLISHEFVQRLPLASPEEFARWSGAAHTLAGNLIDLGEGRLRIELRLLGTDGVRSIQGTVSEPDSLYLRLATGVASLLETSLPDVVTPPLSSPLALVVYGKSLQHYLSGRVQTAVENLSQARQLDPKSTLISHTYRRVESDFAGSTVADTLMAAYKLIRNQPPPAEAASGMLEATQNLLAPLPSTQTGTETSNPYKPPRDAQ